MSNTTFDIQLMDSLTGAAMLAAGGCVVVTVPGSAKKATLLNPDAGFAPMTNPFVPTRGKIRFAIANAAGASPGSTAVDLYGMTSSGRFFVTRNITTGNPTEIVANSNAREQVAVIPFSALDSIANVETDTGFDFPVGCLIAPPPALNVRTAEATRTINVGLLSTQTGGSASGLIVGASVATAGGVKITMTGTPTIGTLLRATVNAQPVPEAGLVALATRLTYTLSAGSVAADGFVVLSYQLTA